VDLHLVQGGWENVVAKQEPPLSPEQLARVRTLLRIHLVFAATTPLLWIVTIVLALRHFPNPPLPGPHSRRHKVLGWLSTIDLTLTSITGLIFYYAAFVARG
jgi:putative membrane protein